MFKRGVNYLLSCVLLVALYQVSARAQATNATITGMVTDPTGAVIPSASLTLTSMATGSVSKAATGPDGFYTFPNLPSGGYELKVAAQGFRDYVQKGITVYINTVARVDVKLELGATQQTVEVSANATLLSTESPTRQEGITPDTIQELPLIVSERPRSAASFAILMPGVTTGGTANPFDARINGGLQSGDEAVVDGVSMQQGLMSQTGMISIFQDFAYSPEMVSEVKLLTANYEPQYGSTTSAQIIANTRAGTNDFHGGVYWFHRNTVLNARQWGTDKRGKNLQNDPGASIGGPAKVPGLWGGRRKTYFFVNFEAFRIAGGAHRDVISVPTMQERAGDFSDWKDSAGNLIPIFDPATSVYDASGNLVSRQQFMGCNGTTPNVICSTDPRLQNTLAGKWFQFLPPPNMTGVTNNYLVPRAIPDVLLGHTNDWLVRVDEYWRDSDHFFASIRYQGAAPQFNSVLPLQLAPEDYTAPQYAFVERGNWDHTFSPTVLNHLALGYLDRNEGYGSIDNKYTDQFPQIPGVASHNCPPSIGFAEFQGFGSNSCLNGKNRTERPSKIVNDLLTWVKGKHTLKFGGEVRWLGENNRTNVNEAGSFSFGDTATHSQDKTLPSGNSVADFLLGYANGANASFYTVSSWYPRAHAYIWHVGDTYKFSPKLTLSFGLRYDNFTPSWEKHDDFSFFDPLSPNPSAGNRLGRLAFAGTGWPAGASFGRRYPEQHWNRGFSPRVGFAYSLSNNTVVRSGYGIFYTQMYYPGWGGGISIDGFNTSASFGSPGGFAPACYLNNPYTTATGSPPGGAVPQCFPQTFAKPPFIDPGADNGLGINYRSFDGNRLPYSQQWNLTVEHQFSSNFYISTAYVGNKGTRLPSTTAPINALNPSVLKDPVLGSINPTTSSVRLNDPIPDDTTVVDGVRSPYPGWFAQVRSSNCGATVAQALLPYPQYCDQLQSSIENAGNSTYHSFQFKAEKRFTRGTFLLASYTLGKILTSSDHPNQPVGAGVWSGAHGVISPYERQRNKGLAYNDVPQVLSVAFVYDLPFGQGKRWASGLGPLNKVVAGWEAAGTFRWSSGIPFFFRNGNCALPTGQLHVACIPAILPDKSLYVKSRSGYDPNIDPTTGLAAQLFSSDAFEAQGLDASGHPVFTTEYGHGPRISNIRGFAYRDQSLALIKDTKLTEKVSWQIRVEAFNLWNWHIFTNSGDWGDPAFNTDLGDVINFGRWNKGNVTDPRVIQVGMRVRF